jgi:chorismate dehydratase
MWDFEHSHAGREFEISYTVPSLCAKALADGTADIGIIPAAAYAQIPGLQVLPDVAIASRRAVRSILLVSQIPVELVRKVALDTSSMTSVALTKVLFEKWMGGGRTFTSMEPDIDKMLNECDAGLLIGDPALRVDRRRYHTVDLAEEWIRYTGKPFVFAFWAVRGEALGEADPAIDIPAVFRESRDHGLEPKNLEMIAREWASQVGLSEEEVRTYLTENIHYQLDSGCLDGLRLFYQYANEIGVLPASPELRFVTANTVVS